MNNADLYRQWVGRYAERIAKPLPSGGANPTPPNPAGQPDPNAGTPLVVPASSSNAFFLTGQVGKDFLKEYNERVKRDYADAQALRVLNWDDSKQAVTGSNPFAIVLTNMILQKSGTRTATQAELEKIAQGNTLPIKGNHYVESSLVWRSNDNPNEYLARNIATRAQGLGIILNPGKAYVLPLYALNLEKDNNSPHKLAFGLGRDGVDFRSAYFEAPILNSKSGSYISYTDIDEKTGLPTKVYDSDVPNKNRQLWTRNSGLSGLYLNRSLDVGSYNVDLAGSSESGRVVCISGAAAAQKS